MPKRYSGNVYLNYLQRIFSQPTNFSDFCNDQEIFRHQIVAQPCKDGFCVALGEPLEVYGQLTGFDYVRGCSTKMFKSGVLNFTFRTNFYPVMGKAGCWRVHAKNLFTPLAGPFYTLNKEFVVCTCLWKNECVLARGSTIVTNFVTNFVIFLFTIILFVVN